MPTTPPTRKRRSLAAAGLLALACAAGAAATGATGAGAGVAPAGVRILGVEPSQAPGYAPGTVDISPGGSVRWTYDDPSDLTHDVDANGGGFRSPDLTPGSPPYEQAFPAKGRFAYHCSFHEAMKGTVRVGGTATGATLSGTRGKVRKRGKKFAVLPRGRAIGFGGTVKTLAAGNVIASGTVTLEGFRAKAGRKLTFSRRAGFSAPATLAPDGSFSGSPSKRPRRGLYRVRVSYAGDSSHLESASGYRYLSVG